MTPYWPCFPTIFISRSAVYAKKALQKHPKPAVKASDKSASADKTVELKGGQKRVVPANKASRFYPAEDVPQPKKSRKAAKAASVRSSITPGTVLILLAGRFRGKRVVCVKTLESGLLLVSGPYKINGVPLRRVNQAYVIATSTKVDLSAAQVRFLSRFISVTMFAVCPPYGVKYSLHWLLIFWFILFI